MGRYDADVPRQSRIGGGAGRVHEVGRPPFYRNLVQTREVPVRLERLGVAAALTERAAKADECAGADGS